MRQKIKYTSEKIGRCLLWHFLGDARSPLGKKITLENQGFMYGYV